MKGMNGRVGLPVRHQNIYPRLHFLGRVVCECQCQNLARQGTSSRDEPRNASRYDLCLTRPRACDYESRPVNVSDCSPLLAIRTDKQRMGIANW